ncbi:hypothetical protein AB0K60_35815 [Thermopolyspora sp. NPDC052614]|uniref:ABC transporter permease subunit n=1 Tax=Thermopolyspora sp. NPDC052614 TaxID=3155682 RepID=UPI00341B21BF
MSEARSEQTDVTLPSWKEVLSTPPPRPAPLEEGPTAAREARDRLLPNLVWEALLALAAAGLVLANLAAAPPQHLTNMFGSAAAAGLLAMGLSLSLRTATPNLAVGVIAGLTGGLTAYLMREGWPDGVAIAAAVGAALVAGVLLGLLTMLLSVPGWALSLGAAAVLSAAYVELIGPATIAVRLGEFPAVPAFVAFAALSMIGGAVWLIPGVRRALGGVRRDGEPGRYAGLRTGLGALVGFAGSSLLAGIAGLADLMRLQAATSPAVQMVPMTALAAVLIGGVSVFGRRAGVFGTLLGVVVVVSAQTLFILSDWPSWTVQMLAGGLVVLGLVVSRLIEGVNDLLNKSRTPN